MVASFQSVSDLFRAVGLVDPSPQIFPDKCAQLIPCT